MRKKPQKKKQANKMSRKRPATKQKNEKHIEENRRRMRRRTSTVPVHLIDDIVLRILDVSVGPQVQANLRHFEKNLKIATIRKNPKNRQQNVKYDRKSEITAKRFGS